MLPQARRKEVELKYEVPGDLPIDHLAAGDQPPVGEHTDPIGEVLGLSVVGTLTVLPLWIILIVYWATRDWPRKRRGVNVTDALAGVARGRVPGQGARVR